MEYTVVAEFKLQNLIYEVNNMIAKGWEPIGGMFVDGSGFYQAMIKK